MKKFTVSVLALAMILSLAACGTKTEETAAPETVEETVAEVVAEVVEETEATVSEVEDPFAGMAVMTYAEYEAAEIDDPVVVETYVQAHQSWWNNTLTVYTQNEDGGIFIYGMECSEEDAAKMVPGTKILVRGYKANFAGEIEIADAKFEFEEGSFIAEPTDVTALLGTDELLAEQNKFVTFKGVTVASEAIYNWDGSGTEGSDLYFDVTVNGQNFQFLVESYLCDATTEVYQAVKELKVGDVVDLEGFMYWYEGPNPHITKVVK